ncbi:ATP-binding protein [Kitasatospora terrestris]|uniref:Histidine kinase/HSP90-like ATPase domain-containing protein n=1 Tax=Kitasatospora terrestris TaxID=258051 RepID=A0ABP9EE90_9ACTN
MRRLLPAPAFYYRLGFPPGARRCVRRGVAFTRRALARRRPGADPAAVDDVLLVAAELLANAAGHAGGPLALDLRFDVDGDGLGIGVTDAAYTPPRLRHPEQGELQGYGLRIVDRLARAWGTTRAGAGKVVWVEMRLPAARGTHARR